MKTLMLALRNLARNQRRSLTTLLAMIIGLVATLIFMPLIILYTRWAYKVMGGKVTASVYVQMRVKRSAAWRPPNFSGLSAPLRLAGQQTTRVHRHSAKAVSVVIDPIPII